MTAIDVTDTKLTWDRGGDEPVDTSRPDSIDRVTVSVEADDPVLRAGLISQLGRAPTVTLVDSSASPAVVTIGSDVINERTCELIGRWRAAGSGVVSVVSSPSAAELLSALIAGASGFVRRQDAHTSLLAATITCVDSGAAPVPEQLLEEFLLHAASPSSIRDGQPNGILNEREAEVLRLAAHGNETADIARLLCYSERTVKGIIHGVTSRLELRNRTHAVAWAVRHGLI